MNDVFQRDGNKYLPNLDQPFIYNIALNYSCLRYARINGCHAMRDGSSVQACNKEVSLIQAPFAQNVTNHPLFVETDRRDLGESRAGQPLFLQDVNSTLLDPNKEFG
jgi:hypothetical protein